MLTWSHTLVGNALFMFVLRTFRSADTMAYWGHVEDTSGTCLGQDSILGYFVQNIETKTQCREDMRQHIKTMSMCSKSCYVWKPKNILQFSICRLAKPDMGNINSNKKNHAWTYYAVILWHNLTCVKSQTQHKNISWDKMTIHHLSCTGHDFLEPLVSS